MSLLLVEIRSNCHKQQQDDTHLHDYTHFFFSLFLPCISFSPPYRNYRHITVHGVRVIYLEPIVNSSLRLNENVERTLQSHANAGHLVKAKYTRVGQVPAHYSWLLGRQQWDSKQGQGKGSKEATTRMAHVKPFWDHAARCRSLTVLYGTCFFE